MYMTAYDWRDVQRSVDNSHHPENMLIKRKTIPARPSRNVRTILGVAIGPVIPPKNYAWTCCTHVPTQCRGSCWCVDKGTQWEPSRLSAVGTQQQYHSQCSRYAIGNCLRNMLYEKLCEIFIRILMMLFVLHVLYA